MGNKFGDFKYKIGDVISDASRSIEVIDRFYIPKSKFKNGKAYTQNEKWYKYKCLKCGNEDSIREYSLCGQNTGCNACCIPPKKIVKGINDISTTAPWMMNYIIDKNYCYSNAKYSNVKTMMKCPDCGRVIEKSALNLYSNHGLSCICGDGKSYPNKFMYAVLEQLNIEFSTEKIFDWSNHKVYDFYIKNDDYDVIIEIQGMQHYSRSISDEGRTLQEEIENDVFKESVAFKNNIKHYFKINASVSDCDFIKSNILQSGLLNILNVAEEDIDWDECNMIATSNLYKIISIYHNDNPLLNRKEIAKHFNVSENYVWKAIKSGVKFGWCNDTLQDTRKAKESNNLIDHGERPIYCVTTDQHYRSSSIACTLLFEQTGIKHNSRALRKSIERDQMYKGNKYIYISREEFNEAKSKFPDKCYGNFFNIKENVA